MNRRGGMDLGYASSSRASRQENAYTESLKDRSHDKCRKNHRFVSPKHKHEVIEAWRREYNEQPVLSALDYRTLKQLIKELLTRSLW